MVFFESDSLSQMEFRHAERVEKYLTGAGPIKPAGASHTQYKKEKKMKTITVSKKVPVILGIIIVFLGIFVFVAPKFTKAAPKQKVITVAANEADTADLTIEDEAEDSSTGMKAVAAAVAIGLAAMGGALGMGIAISKAAEGISRQPEASGKIQGLTMLGLVFIETAIIYALVVAILIVFVM